MAGSTMFNIAYGLRCDSNEDPLLIRITKFQSELNHAAAPTQFLVVSILFWYTHDKTYELANLLECISSFELPSWLPGGSFKKVVKPLGKESRSLLYGTYNLAKTKIVSHVLSHFVIVGFKTVAGGRNCHNIIYL